MLTGRTGGYRVQSLNQYKEHMNEQVDRITSRHIAKCLDQLGNTIVPAQMSSIKRSFRFLADDIKQLVAQGDTHDTEQDSIGNR